MWTVIEPSVIEFRVVMVNLLNQPVSGCKADLKLFALPTSSSSTTIYISSLPHPTLAPTKKLHLQM